MYDPILIAQFQGILAISSYITRIHLHCEPLFTDPIIPTQISARTDQASLNAWSRMYVTQVVHVGKCEKKPTTGLDTLLGNAELEQCSL